MSHLFDKAVETGDVEAFVLADEGGFLMAASGKLEDPDAIAALSSQVFDFEARMRRYHLGEQLSEVTMTTAAGKVFCFRWLESNAEPLVLCALRTHVPPSQTAISHVVASIQRILSPGLATTRAA